jgi:hypothetical protein
MGKRKIVWFILVADKISRRCPVKVLRRHFESKDMQVLQFSVDSIRSNE